MMATFSDVRTTSPEASKKKKHPCHKRDGLNIYIKVFSHSTNTYIEPNFFGCYVIIFFVSNQKSQSSTCSLCSPISTEYYMFMYPTKMKKKKHKPMSTQKIIFLLLIENILIENV